MSTTSAVVFAASFAALYAGHQVADHVLQTDAQARGKTASKGWLVPMFGHINSYFITQSVALIGLMLACRVPLPIGWLFAGLALSVVSHGFIDRRWPVRWLLRHTGSPDLADQTAPICGMYLADQALHVGCLFLSALIIAGGAR